MNKISLFLKGFIIGLGKIIPGVSGALFAILFGVYEELIESISCLKSFVNNYKRIFFLAFGIGLAIIFGSNVIRFLLNTCYVEAMSFFIGIMTFGLMPLLKDLKNTKILKKDFIISLSIIAILILLFSLDFKSSSSLVTGSFKDFISLFLCGVLDAISTIIPGLSGTSLLMMVGYYEIIIDAFASVLSTHFFSVAYILFPFLLGLVLGIVMLAKALKYLFQNYKNIMKITIVGFLIFSLLMLFKNVFLVIYSYEIVSMLIFLFLGFILGYIIENKIK